MNIYIYPLPLRAFRDNETTSSKNVINNNTVKNPHWKQASHLAIYKHGQQV